jgi:hypothetical protein
MDEVNIPDESVAQFLNDLQTIKAEQSNVSVPRDDIATIENLEQFVLKNSSEVINSSINKSCALDCAASCSWRICCARALVHLGGN